MKYVHILVEGQTEETFVRDVLTPFLQAKGVFLIPTLLATKRAKSGSSFKGGVSSYGKIRRDAHRLFLDRNAIRVTTMLDYYGLPEDFPGYTHRPVGTCFQRVEFLEQRFREDIDQWRFIPYLALHEFEAMMFAEPKQIAQVFPSFDITRELQGIRDAYISPEEINEELPPSKRILQLAATYQKPVDGPIVTLEIGIERIRQECAHFNAWLQQLEALADE